MEKGGFPETIEKEPDFIDKILQSYFEVMLYRDLIERYRITNHIALKFFIKKPIHNLLISRAEVIHFVIPFVNFAAM